MKSLFKSVPVLGCLALLSQAVPAQDVRHYSAQARVTDMQPVYQTLFTATDCAKPVTAIGHSIAQDIRQQERRHARQSACENVLRSQHKVRGYWVSYEYRGYEGRKYMRQKPGNWIPVSVRLEPLQATHRH